MMNNSGLNIQTILINKKSALNHQSGQGVKCPVCFSWFFRAPSHLSRAKNPTCSRACACEARKIRIETHCVSCGKSMEQTPSDANRIVTCSKKCSTLRRIKRGGIETNNSHYAFSAYKNAAKIKTKDCKCKKCNTSIGSWVVKGIKAYLQDDGDVIIDDTNAEIWCRRCHLSDIALIGVEARYIRT